ncbi:MAG: hypothetical protein QM820_46685 [Minicystis sp.]
MPTRTACRRSRAAATAEESSPKSATAAKSWSRKRMRLTLESVDAPLARMMSRTFTPAPSAPQLPTRMRVRTPYSRTSSVA